MKRKYFLDSKIVFFLATFILGLFVMGSILKPEVSSKAYGGNFGAQMAPQAGKYQIAGCDGNSAWVIDTENGDVFLIYANGKWKEIGSIMDEKKRIKK